MTAHDYFADTDTITIATTTKDGRELTTPIWAVLVEDVPYIRNGYGEKSTWYRRVQRTGRAAFLDRGVRYEARFEPVVDEHTKQLVDAAYRTKYRGQGWALDEVVSQKVRDYTMRVLLEDH